MSNFVWNGGAGDGTWDTNGNWVGGTAPTSGSHNIYIPASNANVPSITVGPTGTPSFDLVEIQDGFGGTASGVTLGTDSVSLVFGTVTTLRIANKRCQYMKFGGTFTTVYADALGSASLYFSSGGVTSFYGGMDGNVIFEDDVEVTRFIKMGGSFTIKGDSTSPVDLVVSIGGSASGEIWRRIAKGVVSGKLTTAYAAEGDISAGTSTLEVASNGIFIPKSTGNWDEIVYHSGAIIDGTQTPGGSSKPTITTLIGPPSNKVVLPSAKWTVTNTPMVSVPFGPI